MTDDGKFIALVRFESADAARRNSERPEQAAWWNDVSSLFGDCGRPRLRRRWRRTGRAARTPPASSR
ncbi:hypothetical protein ACU686_15000 [Yinghuangia aomiensis]